jgi:Leucine-rich repeat (LRR) protein
MGIKELPADTFEGLSHLQELKLFKNEIQILPEEIFDPVPNLTELHLKDNNLKEIKFRHFENLTHLQRLFLLGNEQLGPLAKVYPNPIAVNQFLNQLKG